MIDLSDLFLQIANNATIPLQTAQQLTNTVDANSSGITGTGAAIIATIGGLLTKHLYDSKKRNETLNVASDIDRMQMIETADNYNDYAQEASLQEQKLRLQMANPTLNEGQILNLVIDDVTKETMGMRLIRFYQDIQKYNEEYYRNTAYKPNSIAYNGKNPLKNVRNLVKDMSTPTPS
jgi:hypothetical protein